MALVSPENRLLHRKMTMNHEDWQAEDPTAREPAPNITPSHVRYLERALADLDGAVNGICTK